MTEFDIEVLQMLNGDKPMERGAWVNVCLEFLQEHGYATLPPYRITDKGREYLRSRKA